MKHFIAAILLACLSYSSGHSQDNKKDTGKQLKTIVESQEYIFKVQRVQTMRKPVNPALNMNGYDLTVSLDSVIAYLPYFGRAYSAPTDPTQGGIKFTSTNFEYTIEESKKGGWLIQIIPRDVQDIQQLTLSIAKNGNSDLQVTSTNRQPIWFAGVIDKR